MQTELEARIKTTPRLRISPTPLLLAAFSLFYFADVLLRASEKYFWYDEIFTLYLTRLNPSSLWEALKSGVDFNPPLFYWLTKAGVAVVGENQIGLRLPEIIGFWVFCLCIYRFVRPRVGLVAAYIAMIFPLLTGAVYYSYEARAHGIVLGFAGLALVCWQMKEEKKQSALWLTLLSLSLFGALMVHCYAVLLIAPFALVELVEALKNFRLNIAVWAALIAPGVMALPIYIPLLQASRRISQGIDLATFSPEWTQLGGFINFLLNPALLILLLAFLLLAIKGITDLLLPARISPRQVWLVLGFTMIPALGVLLAKVSGSLYYGRYLLPALVGICVPLAILFDSWPSRTRLKIEWAFAAMLTFSLLYSFSAAVWLRLHHKGVVLFEPASAEQLDTTPGNPLANESLLLSAREDVPIATIRNLRFLYAAYYMPELGRKLYYLSNSEADPAYRLLRGFAPWGPPFNPPQTFSKFRKSYSLCYLYGEQEVIEQVGDLVHKGWKLDSLQTSQEQNLALVEHPANSHPSSDAISPSK